MSFRRPALLASCLLALSLLSASCKDAAAPTVGEAAIQDIDRRLAGVWRVSSYVPDQALSAALLLTLQTDKIAIRFDKGRVRSVTANLYMDRAYRLADVKGDIFKIFIIDEYGVEYELAGQMDSPRQISFQALTPPWAGRGVLEREGPIFGEAVP
ncbi:MAG: hypothetical protein R3B72_19160 [Polyangiaceae bacterium]